MIKRNCLDVITDGLYDRGRIIEVCCQTSRTTDINLCGWLLSLFSDASST